MARKSSARDFVEIIAWMPWWAGVAAAIVSYLLFTALAQQPLTTMTGAVPSFNVLAMFAIALRWVVPLLCLAGAVMSFVGRAQRRQLLANAQAAPGKSVEGMGWREFEMLVGQAFRVQGYSVAELGGAGPDGGADLLLRRGDDKVLVQCKHWKTQRVGVAVVREMLGAMTAKRATQGWVITSGRYTSEAHAFGREHGIHLVDGEGLPAFLAAHAGQAAEAAAPAARTPAAAPRAPDPAMPTVPACPVCQKAMVARVAKVGARAGSEFWGCSAYPGCRGTRPR